MKACVLIAVLVSTACASSRPVNSIPLAPEGFADAAAYRAARERLIAEERALRLGAGLSLSPEEEQAGRTLMVLKQAELERTRTYFPPARSFLRERTKQSIAQSPVFEVMRRMPKGGILHAHGGAMGDFRWLISYATYLPDCYRYLGEGPIPVRGELRFFQRPPGKEWRLVSELRAAARDPKAFDEELFQSITLGEEELDAPDIWEEFSTIFRRISGLMANRAVAAEYWRILIERLIDENVQYMESRNGTIDDVTLAAVRNVAPRFDMKFITVAGRSQTRERIAQVLGGVIEGRVTHPDRVKGFDLVQEEDRTNTNLYFIDELLAARREAGRRGVTLPLYLHSGESSLPENENLYDAVLLGASRIGHGIALIRHPLLMDIVKARGIAVEVCPTSNQILGYVQDLRLHPAVHYINAGLPIVLSPDDAGIMRNSISHDFYVAFMAWGLDFRALKQLAMNSLLYSAMNEDEKRRALAEWERRWAVFVKWINSREPGAADVANSQH